MVRLLHLYCRKSGLCFALKEPMSLNLPIELTRFNSHHFRHSADYRIDIVGSHILHLVPLKKSDVSVKLGILGLIHGNEIIGLSIINQIIDEILTHVLPVNIEIYFGLGNIPAAQANKRFLETDLNRAFGMNSDLNQETRRAQELQASLLNHCDYLIDLHQTNAPALSPFFIFQSSPIVDWDWISHINPGWPVITQAEPIGLMQGLTTDEYFLKLGKFGVTLEMGQVGNELVNFELGVQTCRRAILHLNEGKPCLKSAISQKSLLLLDYVYQAKSLNCRLYEGFSNLVAVTKGQLLGECETGAILAQQNGRLLFPKYTPVTAVGQELFYICSELNTHLDNPTEAHL